MIVMRDRKQFTLFEQSAIDRVGREDGNIVPYSLAIEHLLQSGRSDFSSDEATIFGDACSHEWQYLEPRCMAAGPLSLCVKGKNPQNLERGSSPFTLPAWIEYDGLELLSCDAKGVLVVDDDSVFMELFRNRVWRHNRLIIVTSLGVPRAEMRRFVKRLSETFRIPVYFLTANDVWGYFSFSVLKRGLIAPHASCRELSIDHLVYIGMRSGVCNRLIKQGRVNARRWTNATTLRVRALQGYICFKSKGWRAELRQFARYRQQCTLHDVVSALGLSDTLSYIEAQISEKNGLT